MEQQLSPQSGPKIAVQLHGGLGNQMFQAAAGLALANRLGGRLMLDTSRFRAAGLRAYALAPFGLDAELRVEGQPYAARIVRAISRVTGRKSIAVPSWWRGAVYREPHFQFDPGFTQLADDVLLAGYFQSPRYFSGHEAGIRAAFALEKIASGAAIEAASMLAGETSVAVHLRRGDYAADPRAAAIHGVLGWDYYDTAVRHIREAVPGARFFVFSDNPTAAAEGAARWPDAEGLAGQSAEDDLFLMSCCRHHVIANSSFSWWSAWLDARAGGIAIAPKAWFTPAASETRDTRDLLPGHWVRL